jgi:succinate-semialdehyde dehydrogenase/glutarate-semialdehyde dehydrogenase
VSATVNVAADELVVVNPASLEEVGRLRSSTPADVADAVADARAAQTVWARVDPDRRRKVLTAAARGTLAAVDEITATVTAETGKPLLEAVTADLFVALDNLAWLARNAHRVLRRERVPMRQPYLLHKRAWLCYEPLGVVGIVSPWNFPFGIPLTQAATAVASGNGVVLKPAEETPFSGAWVEEVFRRAGAPDGLVRVVQGSGDTVGAALVGAAGLAKVVFTGSTVTGRVVAGMCGEQLRPVTLELGGKDPMLVLRDADLARAVEGALWGSFTNCGQVCSGIERILVARELRDAFVELLSRRAASLRPGSGEDPSSDIGPLISESQRARVEELVDDAVASGAEIVTGGRRPDVHAPGWFYAPTVLTEPREGARVHREEVFGPVVTVGSFDNEDDAVRRANSSPYGLGASVWTRDRRRGLELAARLEAGSVWMNDACYSYGVCQAPWGGTKASGYGRTHSKHGLYGLSNVKFVDADSGRLSPAWWYPYSDGAVEGFRHALGVLYGSGVARRAGTAWAGRRELLALGRRMRRR